MKRYDGQKLVAGAVLLAVIGAVQSQGGLVTEPIDPALAGYVMMAFAATILVLRFFTRGPLPCRERRNYNRLAT